MGSVMQERLLTFRPSVFVWTDVEAETSILWPPDATS